VVTHPSAPKVHTTTVRENPRGYGQPTAKAPHKTEAAVHMTTVTTQSSTTTYANEKSRRPLVDW
jgi:hypothetical protein